MTRFFHFLFHWWQTVRDNGNRRLDPTQLMQPQTPTSGLGAIFGKWPGDETDEELLAALKRMG